MIHSVTHKGKGKGMSYRGGSVTKTKSVAKILEEREKRRKKTHDLIAKQTRKSLSPTCFRMARYGTFPRFKNIWNPIRLWYVCGYVSG